MSDEEMNTEILLDHYRNPHNYGQVEGPTAKVLEYNPVCGDTVQMTVKISDRKVVEAKFIGRGCSISQGTASMLTDHVTGKTVEEVKNIKEGDVLSMLGLKLGPSREKCALLSLNTLQKCIREYEDKGGKN